MKDTSNANIAELAELESGSRNTGPILLQRSQHHHHHNHQDNSASLDASDSSREQSENEDGDKKLHSPRALQQQPRNARTPSTAESDGVALVHSISATDLFGDAPTTTNSSHASATGVLVAPRPPSSPSSTVLISPRGRKRVSRLPASISSAASANATTLSTHSHKLPNAAPMTTAASDELSPFPDAEPSRVFQHLLCEHDISPSLNILHNFAVFSFAVAPVLLRFDIGFDSLLTMPTLVLGLVLHHEIVLRNAAELSISGAMAKFAVTGCIIIIGLCIDVAGVHRKLSAWEALSASHDVAWASVQLATASAVNATSLALNMLILHRCFSLRSSLIQQTVLIHCGSTTKESRKDGSNNGNGNGNVEHDPDLTPLGVRVTPMHRRGLDSSGSGEDTITDKNQMVRLAKFNPLTPAAWSSTTPNSGDLTIGIVDAGISGAPLYNNNNNSNSNANFEAESNLSSISELDERCVSTTLPSVANPNSVSGNSSAMLSIKRSRSVRIPSSLLMTSGGGSDTSSSITAGTGGTGRSPSHSQQRQQQQAQRQQISSISRPTPRMDVQMIPSAVCLTAQVRSSAGWGIVNCFKSLFDVAAASAAAAAAEKSPPSNVANSSKPKSNQQNQPPINLNDYSKHVCALMERYFVTLHEDLYHIARDNDAVLKAHVDSDAVSLIWPQRSQGSCAAAMHAAYQLECAMTEFFMTDVWNKKNQRDGSGSGSGTVSAESLIVGKFIAENISLHVGISTGLAYRAVTVDRHGNPVLTHQQLHQHRSGCAQDTGTNCFSFPHSTSYHGPAVSDSKRLMRLANVLQFPVLAHDEVVKMSPYSHAWRPVDVVQLHGKAAQRARETEAAPSPKAGVSAKALSTAASPSPKKANGGASQSNKSFPTTTTTPAAAAVSPDAVLVHEVKYPLQVDESEAEEWMYHVHQLETSCQVGDLSDAFLAVLQNAPESAMALFSQKLQVQPENAVAKRWVARLQAHLSSVNNGNRDGASLARQLREEWWEFATELD